MCIRSYDAEFEVPESVTLASTEIEVQSFLYRLQREKQLSPFNFCLPGMTGAQLLRFSERNLAELYDSAEAAKAI